VRLDDRVVLGRQARRDLLGVDDPALARLDHHLGGGGISLRHLQPDQEGNGGDHRGDPEDDAPAPPQNGEQLAQRKPAFRVRIGALGVRIVGLR
jgi:hypothetical protein